MGPGEKTSCSSRGSAFGSQHPHWTSHNSQPCVNQSPDYLIPSSDLGGLLHRCDINSQKNKVGSGRKSRATSFYFSMLAFKSYKMVVKPRAQALNG